MFKGVLDFFHANPALYGSGFVIFIVLVVAFWIFTRLRRKKGQYKSAGQEVKKEPAAQTVLKPEVVPPSPVLPLPVPPEPLYACSCGAIDMTKKELEKHLLLMGRKEKGKHKSLGRIENVPAPPVQVSQGGTKLNVAENEQYRAVIWRYAGGGRESVIEFKQRINQPLGEIWYAEPSLPISGECYCIKELENGNFEPFDPRKSNLTANESPTQAYSAAHWGRADGVWMYVQSPMQKISMFVIGGFLFITMIAILIKLGSK